MSAFMHFRLVLEEQKTSLSYGLSPHGGGLENSRISETDASISEQGEMNALAEICLSPATSMDNSASVRAYGCCDGERAEPGDHQRLATPVFQPDTRR